MDDGERLGRARDAHVEQAQSGPVGGHELARFHDHNVVELQALGFGRLEHRDGGTMVVIEGPRFSTKAESRMYAQLGADVIGMTQFPEAPLARELELCFGNVALVTDYDVGVDDIPPVTHEEVLKVFGENIDKLRDLLFAAIPDVPAERTCPCATALAGTGHD